MLDNLTAKGDNNIFLLDFLTAVFEKENRSGSTHSATLAAAEKELAEKEAYWISRSPVPENESESHSVLGSLYSPWNSPGQNTGEGSHSLL